MPPDTAFIIPARNAASTLDMTIESVIAQTSQGWEAIIVDDGSTDETPTLIAAWERRDSRIRSIRQGGSGLSSARNVGARTSQASKLVFLDADDLLTSNYLAFMLAKWQQTPEVALVHCAGARLAPDGRIGPAEIPPKTEYFHHLVRYNPFFVHSCMIKREIFEDFGGFDQTMPAVEEWDLWQRLARSKLQFAAIDECLTLYRMRADSMVRDYTRVLPSAILVVKRGHDVDPRVKSPAPEFVNGCRDDAVESRVLNITLWVAGVVIGANQKLEPILEKLSLAPKSAAGPDLYPLSVLRHGILIGACALPVDWPGLIPRVANSLQEVLGCLKKRLGDLGCCLAKDYDPEIAALVDSI